MNRREALLYQSILLFGCLACVAGCARAVSSPPASCSMEVFTTPSIARGCVDQPGATPYLQRISRETDAELRKIEPNRYDSALLLFRFAEQGIAEACVDSWSSESLAKELGLALARVQRRYTESPPTCLMGARFEIALGVPTRDRERFCPSLSQEEAERPIHDVPPAFPKAAVWVHQAGHVVFQLRVLPDGSVGEITVTESSPPGVFDNAVLDAVRQWRFCPEIPGRIEYTRPLVKRLDFDFDPQ